MFLVLMSVGGAAAVMGACMIAIGIPINEFGLGNTLIVAGTTLFTGGLIVMALAAVVRQLAALRETLAMGIPQSASPSEPPDFGAPMHVPPATRMMPPTSVTRDERDRVPDRSQDRPYDNRMALPPLDRVTVTVADTARTASAPVPVAESPVVEDTENFPLSPLPPLRVAPGSLPFPGASQDDSRIPREDMPRPAGSMSLRALRTEARIEDTADAPVERDALERSPRTIFDALWPDEAKKRKAQEGQRSVPDFAPVVEHAVAAPAPDDSPEEARDAARGKTSSAQKAAVLKSGVIEGMAYTLYTDGSIEAQMSSGTIRFGSIEELRAHLETTDSN